MLRWGPRFRESRLDRWRLVAVREFSGSPAAGYVAARVPWPPAASGAGKSRTGKFPGGSRTLLENPIRKG